MHWSFFCFLGGDSEKLLLLYIYFFWWGEGPSHSTYERPLYYSWMGSGQNRIFVNGGGGAKNCFLL